MTSSYSANNITVLKGLEAVRKRPGMYIGSTGPDGLHHLVYEVVDNSIDEAMAGHCKKIIVALEKDDICRVEDDGRGIPVDIHPTEKVSALELVLTRLHAGGKFDKSNYKVSGGLHGVGVSCVNALSVWLEAFVNRDGKRYTQRFEKGVPKTKVECIGETELHGTTIRWKSDASIFQETTTYSFEVLSNRLRELAFLNPGIVIIFRDERLETPKELVLSFEGGINEYTKFINTGKKVIPEEPIFISGEQNDIITELSMQYNEGFNENVYSYVNDINTREGGTHLDGMKNALTFVFNKSLEKNEKLFKKLNPKYNPKAKENKEKLEKLAEIEGCYVPSLQNFSQIRRRIYKSDSCISSPIVAEDTAFSDTFEFSIISFNNYNYKIENNKQTIPGTYTITASLMEGYIWNDDSSEPVVLNCTINKNEITVVSDSKTKIYDGLDLTASATITKGNIYDNMIVYDSTSSIINIGTVANKGIIKVLDKNNNDVTNNFIINKVEGTLEITKNYISVTTGSSSKLYDKTPLTNSVISLTSGNLINNDVLKFDSDATITTPGTKENTGIIKVLDKNSNDVTNNYSLNITFGILEVTGEYTVTYSFNDDNYSDVTISVTSKKIYHGDDVDLTLTASKEGWTFVGWNTDKNSKNKLTALTATSDITLYAIFKKDVAPLYAFNVVDNKPDFKDFLCDVYIYSENETASVTLLNVSVGNQETYFSETDDLNIDNLYTVNQEITVGKDGLKLYFIWGYKATITYNTNGGNTINSQKIRYNSVVNKPDDPIKNGFIFKGWQLNGVNYDFNSKVTKDIILIAVWEKVIVPDSLTDILINNNYKIKDNLVLGFKVGDTVEEINTKFEGKAIIESEYSIITTGSRIRMNEDIYTIVIKGDLDGDGEISSSDLLKMRKHMLNDISLSGAYKEAGLSSDDTEISSLDLLRLRKYMLGEYEY